jgi:hypothetical protein
MMFLRVIACEIAARELYYAAGKTQNMVDIELLTQGYHDTPSKGRDELQKRIDAVPAGKYDAVVLGYGLCSNILAGVQTSHTKLIIPRAHDCITFFLGSKERYQTCFSEHPGTYYYTSGWLECAKRRGMSGPVWANASLPAGASLGIKGDYEEWVKKYGEEQAQFLLEEMGRWAESYSHGALIDFDFTSHLKLKEQVCSICKDRGWSFSEIAGDISLLQTLVDGPWPDEAFLTVEPGQKVRPSFDEKIIAAEPASGI